MEGSLMHDRVFKHTEAHKLEDPERLRWLPPAEVISHLRLLPGMKIADIGAGTGYFSIPIARAVGDGGRVPAADLQPEMLELLRQKLSQDRPFHFLPSTAPMRCDRSCHHL
jgi:precorrin-6B methylase 2